MKRILPVLLASLLAACVYPQTTVSTGSKQPGIVVKGAPAGAVLYVDGLAMGAAQQYDGNPNVLTVLEGVHQVEIRQGANVIYHDKVYVGSGETRALTLLPGAQP